jgi:hypothetical protein
LAFDPARDCVIIATRCSPAAMLGLTLSASLLSRADEVIE